MKIVDFCIFGYFSRFVDRIAGFRDGERPGAFPVVIVSILFERHGINTCRRKAFMGLKVMECALSALHFFPDLSFPRPAFFGESERLGGPFEFN